MSSYFGATPTGGGTPAGGSPYFGATPGLPKASHPGLLGALGNDISASVTGFVPGVKQLVHDPVGTAKQIAHAEYQTWAPFVSAYKGLFTGNMAQYRLNSAKFDKLFYEHPLGPILDLLTVAGFGGARVAALSKLPENATLGMARNAALTGRYQGDLRTLTARAAEGGKPIVTRTLPRNAYRAGRMQVTDTLLKKVVPADRTMLGEYARAARAVNREAIPVQLRHLFNPVTQQYFRAFSKLNPRERIALGILQRWPLPKDVAAVVQKLEATGAGDSTLAQALKDPLVHADYLDPTPHMLAAHEAGRAVTQLREQILLHRNAISPETVAEAPFRQTRAARGEGIIHPEAKAIDAEIRKLGGLLAAKHVEGRAEAVAPYSESAVTGKIAKLQGELAKFPPPKPLTSAADLRAEIAAAGRPQPYYVKDVMVDKKGPYMGGEMGGGLTPQRVGADVYQSHAILQNLGHMILHPDVIGPAFLRAARHDFYTEKYHLVRDHATAIPKGVGRPAGYLWVRQVRGERIPYTETQMGEHVAQAQEAFSHLPEHADFTLAPGESEDLIATDAQGNRLAVPEHFAKGVSGEFNRAASGVQKMIANPLTVWRAAILNLRIPWLENNIIGNAMMTAIKLAGPGGLAAVLSMILHTKGVEAARAALGMAKAEGLDTEFIAKQLPELGRGGTFIGTQLPTGIRAKLPEKLQPAAKVPGKVIGFLPSIDRATEGAYRRFGAESFLRRQPEVKAILKQMPKQERSFRKAAEQALNENPHLRRLTVREVNDALGDYLSLSPFERNYVRSLVPFYGWFREISRIVGKLAIDTPGRANVVAKVGMVGAEWAQQQTGALPSFLQGFLPTSPQGATQTGLALRSMNPYTSFLDVANSALSGTPYASRASASSLLGEANPFLSGGADYLSQLSHGNVKPGYGLLAAMAQPLTTQLPEVRLFTNPSSRLYPGRTRKEMLEQFFGSPVRRISPQQAHLYASQGR